MAWFHEPRCGIGKWGHCYTLIKDRWLVFPGLIQFQGTGREEDGLFQICQDMVRYRTLDATARTERRRPGPVRRRNSGISQHMSGMRKSHGAVRERRESGCPTLGQTWLHCR